MSNASNPENAPTAEPALDGDDNAPIELTEILALPLPSATPAFSSSSVVAPAIASLRQTLLAELLEQLQPLIDKELHRRMQPVFDELVLRLRPALESATQQLVEDAIWRALSSVLDQTAMASAAAIDPRSNPQPPTV